MTNQLAELLEARHLLGEIINYFEEIEELLAKESKFPVKLVQRAKAFQAFNAISEVIDELDEVRRLRKHWEADAVAETFIRQNIRFLTENDLTAEQLAEHMGMFPDVLQMICDPRLLLDEEPGDE